MFRSIFSFEGRIRRTEFGISYIIYIVLYLAVLYISKAVQGGGIVWLPFLPVVWFLIAQAAKRCHDVGNSGWWQLIPFYVFWLIFQAGQPGDNEYGRDPKESRLFDPENYTDPSPLPPNPYPMPGNNDTPIS